MSQTRDLSWTERKVGGKTEWMDPPPQKKMNVTKRKDKLRERKDRMETKTNLETNKKEEEMIKRKKPNE